MQSTPEQKPRASRFVSAAGRDPRLVDFFFVQSIGVKRGPEGPGDKEEKE